MASLAAQPLSGVCIERRNLGAAYLNAVHDLNELLEAQAMALVEGQPKLERFDLALTVARERRDRTKLAWASHVQAHGC